MVSETIIVIFRSDKSCNINQLFFDLIFLLSRASSNAYRNFGLGWGYHLGGDPLSGLGSRLGGYLVGRFPCHLVGCLGDCLGDRLGSNLGGHLGDDLGSSLGGCLGGYPVG